MYKKKKKKKKKGEAPFFLHIVKWFCLFLSNMNNSVYHKSFICS